MGILPKGEGKLSDTILTKDVSIEFKVNLTKRQFEGYASTFGNEDLVGDIIENGAFRKTIAERGPLGSNDIKLLWEHRGAFGMPVKMYEDDYGLYVIGEASDTQENKDRLVYMRDGVVKSMSIGFSIPEGKSWFEDDGWTRHIQEVKLYECSPVTFPANEAAVITNVSKHIELDLLVKAIGKENLIDSARSLPSIDQRRLDLAIGVLSEIKTEMFGSIEEKRMLNAMRKGEPLEDNTSSKDDTDPEYVKALQSAWEEIVLENTLSQIRGG